MKKLLMILSTIAVVAMAMFGGYKGVALAANQSEDAIPQSKDLCGDTGGNGQIVSVGNNEFTMKRNDDDSNQIVHLTNQARIETPTGYASASDLKIGDRVTLVGGPNRDGSFTADTVVVCNGPQQIEPGANETSQVTPRITVQNKNPAEYEKVSGVINVATMFLVGLIWFAAAAFLLLKKKQSLVDVLYFTIFYVYLYKVLDYTLLQFQSLLLLQHFVPNLLLRGVESGRSVNLIPLATLTLKDVKTSLLNVLFMMPFGFGLPFITNLRFKKVATVGLLLSIGIELLQFITGLLANTTFRVADINDLICNTVGVAIGYILFVAFVRIYHHTSHHWKIRDFPILQYIADRPQLDK